MPGIAKTRASTRATRAARRFYALPIDADDLAASAEIIRAADSKDLVAAHLTRHDKGSPTLASTLSGFFVLERQGSRTYLADLRDSQQVFRRDSEREVPRLAFDNVGAFREFQAARRAHAADEDEEQIAERFRPRHLALRSSRSPSTPELFRCYHWLVALLERPSSSWDRAEEQAGLAASSSLRQIFKTRRHEIGAFHHERSNIRCDPHLAIYWLLHASILADDEVLALVRDDLATSTQPLVRAFLDTFGRLGPADEFPWFPTFRECRSWLLYSLGAYHDQPDLQRLAGALSSARGSDAFFKASHFITNASALNALDTVHAFARVNVNAPSRPNE